jgi:hypothetical protein
MRSQSPGLTQNDEKRPAPALGGDGASAAGLDGGEASRGG